MRAINQSVCAIMIFGVVALGIAGCDGGGPTTSPAGVANADPPSKATLLAAWEQQVKRIEANVNAYNKDRADEAPGETVEKAYVRHDLKKSDSVITPYKGEVLLETKDDRGKHGFSNKSATVTYDFSNGTWTHTRWECALRSTLGEGDTNRKDVYMPGQKDMPGYVYDCVRAVAGPLSQGGVGPDR
jgi:hypothetical protein